MASPRKMSGGSSRQMTKSGKLPVGEPTSIRKFAVILVMHLCKKVLLVDTSYKLAIYVCGLTAGSVLTDIFPFPKSFLADKGFILNWLFVRYGWGWTCLLVGLFIYHTSFVYCCGNMTMVKKHLSRMAVSTVWWFTWTTVFDYIEQATGFCTVDLGIEHFDDKHSCRQAGGKWYGFDISGHAFLLIYNLLVISEEVKPINGWERISEIVNEEEEKLSGRFSESDLVQLKMSYEEKTPTVRVLAIVLMFLTFIFELMLLGTTLYFHNMPQKIVGALFAALGWFLTYRVWYKLDFSPGESGTGKFRYIKEAKGKNI